MDRHKKLELIQRTLGIRHKLKVYDSVKIPDTHEDLSAAMLSKWELEDELLAIEEILADLRKGNVAHKKLSLQKDGLTLKRDLSKGMLERGALQTVK